ncbi:hypothetical protein HWV62_21382 [Athelia sp. TMB]|nr:hypothetical protein HWV62_21382 [Athelia sp. TMB]
MIIIEDDKSRPASAPVPPVPSGSVAQLQPSYSAPIVLEPQEYAELPPAYEEVMSLDGIAGPSAPGPSRPRAAARSASDSSRTSNSRRKARVPPGAAASEPDGRRYPTTASLHPHYYSSDSYGGPIASTTSSPTHTLLTYIGDKLGPGVHNPPTLLPPSFMRHPPPGLSYDLFQPTYLLDLGGLNFPMKPPPSRVQPHPFITHDVNQLDWKRFLDDIRKTAVRKQTEQRGSILIAADFIGEIISATKGSASRPKTVSTLVDIWNEHFFHPRRLEAILAIGRKRIDSGSGPVPEFDPLIEATASRLTRSTSTQDLAAASKALVLKSRMVINDKKRAVEKLLEPIMSSNEDAASKGKARWESDMRHRLFIVGF